MVNYIDHIILDNTVFDTGYTLGYDWSKYKLQVNFEYLSEYTGAPYISHDFVRWSGNAFNTQLAGQQFSGWTQIQERTYISYIRGQYGSNSTRVEGYWTYDWEEKYTDNGNNTYTYYWNNDGHHSFSDVVTEKYVDNEGNLREWGRVIIGGREHPGKYGIKRIKLTVDDVVVMELKPCVDENGRECFYDTVSEKYLYPEGFLPSDSMMKTVVMSGERQELPISDGIEKNKIQNRIIEVNKYVDGYAAKYDEICLSADEDNMEGILVSDYTENNQINHGGIADWIEIKPRGMLVIPRNRQITALNRPLVKGHRGDLLRIVVR